MIPRTLLVRSYPTEPAGWTRVQKDPDTDPSIPLEGNPNPIAEDPIVALFQVEGIEAALSDAVSDT